jgi:hypothetical protein
MEFFQKVHNPDMDITDLKQLLTINSLTGLCASISSVTSLNDNEADIYCVWGAFVVRREEIRYGIRFSLLNCPHALAWTITYHEEDQNIVIHCTIDETETEQDFIESIDEFVADWSTGIAKALK